MSQLDKFYRYIRPIYICIMIWYLHFETLPSKILHCLLYRQKKSQKDYTYNAFTIHLDHYKGVYKRIFLPSYFWIYTAHPIHSLKIHSFYRYMHGYTNDIVFFNGVYKYISNLSQRSLFLLTIPIFILNFAINVLIKIFFPRFFF